MTRSPIKETYQGTAKNIPLLESSQADQIQSKLELSLPQIKTWPPVLARQPPSSDCNSPSLVHLARTVVSQYSQNWQIFSWRCTSRRQICCIYSLWRPSPSLPPHTRPPSSPQRCSVEGWTSLCCPVQNVCVHIFGVERNVLVNLQRGEHKFLGPCLLFLEAAAFGDHLVETWDLVKPPPACSTGGGISSRGRNWAHQSTAWVGVQNSGYLDSGQ